MNRQRAFHREMAVLHGILAVACLAAGNLRADVRPSGMFGDHMVLQRNQPVPVWGTADPGEEVSVEVAGQKKSVVAGRDGRWRVELDPLPADSKPKELVIRGRNTVTFSDVLVGDIWLCGGQSNMAMALADADGAEAEMRAEDPLLRACRIPERPGERPWTSVDGQWVSFVPPGSRQWSATPYFLAKALRRELGVPVGVIVCAWGGSSAVAWMSPEALRASFRAEVPEEVIGWRSNIQPSRLYLGMLYPVAPFAVAGVAWYQGETDGEPMMNPFLYRRLFPALIADWRRLWNRPEMPFYWFQLPGLRKKDSWPVVREGQSMAAVLPRTGCVPTIDIGQEANLHPTNKREFAGRLADLILAREYGREGWMGFPEFEKLSRADGSLRIQFRNAPGGLKTTDGAPPRGFAVLAQDGVFVPAAARIDGDAVILPDGEAVRYAWEGNPSVNLVNAAGLPAAPFRTDTQPVLGEEFTPQDLPVRAPLPGAANGGDLARGAAAEWQMQTRGVPAGDLEKLRILRPEKSFCQIAVADLRRASMTTGSPAVFWQSSASPVPGQGLTLDARVQIYRATDPFRGFDLEAVRASADGSLRRYRVSIVPMRVYAFGDKTILLLASNLENTTGPRQYRLAVRPDGVAQVYLDGELLGVFGGEAVEAAEDLKPSVRAGKIVENGEFTANFYEAAADVTGAFAPSP